MKFTEKLMKHLLMELNGGLELTYENTKISFDGEWPRISFRNLVLKDCGIDIDKFATRDALLEEIKRNDITFEDDVDVKKAGRATLIDLLYKKVSRPKLVNPIFSRSIPSRSRRWRGETTPIPWWSTVSSSWSTAGK